MTARRSTTIPQRSDEAVSDKPRTGKYSTPSKTNTSLAKPSKQDAVVQTDETDQVPSSASSRGSGSVKYLIFGLVAFVAAIVASTALVSPIGTVIAAVGKVNSNTSMLDMLNQWFFPMFTLSIIVAGLSLFALRRVWHSIEKRFN